MSRPEEGTDGGRGQRVGGSSPHVESKMRVGWSVEGHLLYPRLSGLQLFIQPPVARTAISCTQGDHLCTVSDKGIDPCWSPHVPSGSLG